MGRRIGAYSLDRYVGRGFYGATFYARNRIEKEFAIKVSPQKLYEDQAKSFDEEIIKYRRLGSHPNIAELHTAGDATLNADGTSIEVFYVVMEWVDGKQLSQFLVDAAETLTVSQLYGAILDIASGVARFESKNLWHNDLNASNILVKELTPEELDTRQTQSPYILKIVDSGSAVFRQTERHKALDDLRCLGQHINRMRQILLRRYGLLPKEDQFFLDELAKIIAHMMDEHPTRSAGTAAVVVDEARSLYARRFILGEEAPLAMPDPFAYLNANDFPSDAYITRLFSDRLPWPRSITSSEIQSMLITGPRGSGKTMILRSMRLKTSLHPSTPTEPLEETKAQLMRDRLAGFFVSARLDIGNHCPLTKLPPWIVDAELVNEYFTLLYVYEILDSLHYGTQRGIIDVSPAAERVVCTTICELMEASLMPTVSGLLSFVSSRQNAILSGRAKGPVAAGMIGPRPLVKWSTILRDNIPFFADKNIVFLLDDFSLPKVPLEAQQALLPIIWNPGGGYSFRVTTHSESVVQRDIKGIQYVPNRDFAEINLGAEYVNGTDRGRGADHIKSALEDILARRFSLVKDYSTVEMDELLGPERNPAIAKAIQQLDKAKKLHSLRYAGWPTLIKLCSGDISYIIDMLRRILSTRPAKVPVSADVENLEIRRYARNELYRLQDYAVSTCNLYEVAMSFAKFSRFKLLHEPVGKGRRPAEYLRIEVQIARLSAEARSAMADLLRNGVFVDGGFSSSSGGTPARRLIFKKLFTPAFPTTYRSRDTWPMTALHFVEFARDPSAYVKRILGEHGIPPAQQSLALDALIHPVE